MANERRLIDANALKNELSKLEASGGHKYYRKGMDDTLHFHMPHIIDDAPTVDAVEVMHGYHPGDVCIYGFHKENKSLAIVEIVKILNDERGVAEIKFLKVFVDDTGNGLFNYLLRSGKTMNASFCYLKNITPIDAKMDGDASYPKDPEEQESFAEYLFSQGLTLGDLNGGCDNFFLEHRVDK